MKRVRWVVIIFLCFNLNLGANEDEIIEAGNNKNKSFTRFLNFAENSKKFSEWCTLNFNEQEQEYIDNPTRASFLRNVYDSVNGNNVKVFLERSKLIDAEIIRLKKKKNKSGVNLNVLEKLQAHINEAKKQKLINWLAKKIELEQDQIAKILEDSKKSMFVTKIWEKVEGGDKKSIIEAKKILKNKLLTIEKLISNHPLKASEKILKEVQLLEGILLYINNAETEQSLESTEKLEPEEIATENIIEKIWQGGKSCLLEVLKIGAYTVGAPITLPFMAVKKLIETSKYLIYWYKGLTKNADEQTTINNIANELERIGKTSVSMGGGATSIITTLLSYSIVPLFVLTAPGIYNWYKFGEAHSPTWELFKHYVLDKIVTHKMKLAAKTFLTTGGLALKTVLDDIFGILPEKAKFGQKDVLGIYRLAKKAISNRIDTFSEILTIYLKKDVPARYRLIKMNEKFWDALLGQGFHHWIVYGNGRKILEKTKIMPMLQGIGGFYKWLYHASGRILKTTIEAPFNLLEKRPWLR